MTSRRYHCFLNASSTALVVILALLLSLAGVMS